MVGLVVSMVGLVVSMVGLVVSMVGLVVSMVGLVVSVVGLVVSMVGLVVSMVGLVVSMVGLVVSMVGLVVSMVGLVVSMVGLVVSMVGLVVSMVGLVVSMVGLVVSMVGLVVSMVGLVVSMVGLVVSMVGGKFATPSVSLSFFLHLTFLSLHSLSAVSNSFYLRHFFLNFSLCLSMYLSSNPPSQFRASFPSFPLLVLSICCLCQFFISHPFRMSNYSSPILNTFLHSILHPQFIHSSLISCLNCQHSSYQVCFANLYFLLWFLCLCQRVASPFMYAGANTRAEHMSFKFT